MVPEDIERESEAEADPLSEGSTLAISKFIQEWVAEKGGASGAGKGRAPEGGNAGHKDDANDSLSKQDTLRSSSSLADAARHAEKPQADPPRVGDSLGLQQHSSAPDTLRGASRPSGRADAEGTSNIPLHREPLVAPRPNDL